MQLTNSHIALSSIRVSTNMFTVCPRVTITSTCEEMCSWNSFARLICTSVTQRPGESVHWEYDGEMFDNGACRRAKRVWKKTHLTRPACASYHWFLSSINAIVLQVTLSRTRITIWEWFTPICGNEFTRTRVFSPFSVVKWCSKEDLLRIRSFHLFILPSMNTGYFARFEGRP